MSLLDPILESTRQRIRVLKATPIKAITKKRSHSFINSLKKSGLSLIAEVKKASPSKGVIRESFDPISLAANFEQSGASALSVLTEPDYFLGSPDFLREIRQTVSLPILRKDFILDPVQIPEAVAMGADAILLIQALLSVTQTQELLSAAYEVGLDVLLEVHEASELALSSQLKGVELIGVNNRNLKTFEMQMDRASQLFPTLQAEFPRAVLVAESGYSTPEELTPLATQGFQAVLIGEGLAKQAKLLEYFRRAVS